MTRINRLFESFNQPSPDNSAEQGSNDDIASRRKTRCHLGSRAVFHVPGEELLGEMQVLRTSEDRKKFNSALGQVLAELKDPAKRQERMRAAQEYDERNKDIPPQHS